MDLLNKKTKTIMSAIAMPDNNIIAPERPPVFSAVVFMFCSLMVMSRSLKLFTAARVFVCAEVT